MLPCAQSPVSYAPPTHFLGLQSKDSVRVSDPVMRCCVSGDVRQETLIHDGGDLVRMVSDEVGAVTKCSSQWISLRPTSLGDLVEESSTLPAPPPCLACICISLM